MKIEIDLKPSSVWHERVSGEVEGMLVEVCYDTLSAYFDLPEDMCDVTLVVSDRPQKESYLCWMDYCDVVVQGSDGERVHHYLLSTTQYAIDMLGLGDQPFFVSVKV